MDIELNNIPIQVMAVRVDGKRITQSFLEQIPIYSIWQYICDNQLTDFEFDYSEYDFICRLSAVPVIKALKAHYTKIKSPYQDSGIVYSQIERYVNYDEFGLWSLEGELYLHPCGYSPKYTGYGGPFSGVDDNWYDILNHFDDCFIDAPRALIGV